MLKLVTYKFLLNISVYLIIFLPAAAAESIACPWTWQRSRFDLDP